jgi:3-hydroxy-9,10-secoandrosta-1,3,5(10)-triene-9,17-dione monooxygenase reductase component
MTGVTIVTTRAPDGTPVGLTANAFTSVSLDPPLVLVCVDKRVGSYPAFRLGGYYAIHVLREDQAELSTRFATRGADKFAGLRCRRGLGDTPVLSTYLSLFECEIVQAHDAGDHTIFIGHVQRLEIPPGDLPPLGFLRGRYAEAHRPQAGPAAVYEPPPEHLAMWSLGWA